MLSDPDPVSSILFICFSCSCSFPLFSRATSLVTSSISTAETPPGPPAASDKYSAPFLIVSTVISPFSFESDCCPLVLRKSASLNPSFVSNCCPLASRKSSSLKPLLSFSTFFKIKSDSLNPSFVSDCSPLVLRKSPSSKPLLSFSTIKSDSLNPSFFCKKSLSSKPSFDSKFLSSRCSISFTSFLPISE